MGNSIGVYGAVDSNDIGAYMTGAGGGPPSPAELGSAMPSDIALYNDFISTWVTPGKSINNDYRDALALALGYTLEQGLDIGIDNLYYEYVHGTTS